MPFNQRRATHACVHLVMLVYPDYCSCDLDLDPMTLMYEVDLNTLKMYWHTKMTFLRQAFEKLGHERHKHRHRQTDKCDRTHYQPHSRVVLKTIVNDSGQKHTAAIKWYIIRQTCHRNFAVQQFVYPLPSNHTSLSSELLLTCTNNSAHSVSQSENCTTFIFLKCRAKSLNLAENTRKLTKLSTQGLTRTRSYYYNFW